MTATGAVPDVADECSYDVRGPCIGAFVTIMPADTSCALDCESTSFVSLCACLLVNGGRA